MVRLTEEILEDIDSNLGFIEEQIYEMRRAVTADKRMNAYIFKFGENFVRENYVAFELVAYRGMSVKSILSNEWDIAAAVLSEEDYWQGLYMVRLALKNLDVDTLYPIAKEAWDKANDPNYTDDIQF